jgi:hypothetical protein
MAFECAKLAFFLEAGSLRKGVPWFKIFLAIEGGGFDIRHSCIIGGAQEDHIGWKEFLILDFADVSDDNFAPLEYFKLPVSDDGYGLLMVVLIIALMSLPIFVACVRRDVYLSG